MTALRKLSVDSQGSGVRENGFQSIPQRNESIFEEGPVSLLSDSRAMYVTYGPLSSLTTAFDNQLRTMDSKVEKWQQQEIAWAAQLQTHVQVKHIVFISSFLKWFVQQPLKTPKIILYCMCRRFKIFKMRCCLWWLSFSFSLENMALSICFALPDRIFSEIPSSICAKRRSSRPLHHRNLELQRHIPALRLLFCALLADGFALDHRHGGPEAAHQRGRGAPPTFRVREFPDRQSAQMIGRAAA